jgi:ABC-type sugar transport system substrate-binding protein
VAFSASTIDTLSSASLSARAALSHAAGASFAKVYAASTSAMWVASIASATSHAWVTSASNIGTSTLPQDKSYRNKTQEGMRDCGGSQKHAGKIFFSFQTNPNQTQDVPVNRGRHLMQQPLHSGDL